MGDVRTDTDLLLRALDAVAGHVDECRLVADDGRLRFVAGGYRNVVSVAVDIDATLDGAEQWTVGVNVDRLRNVLSAASLSDSVTIEREGRQLEVAGGGTTYTNRLIDPEIVEEHQIPDGITLPAGVTVPARAFDRLLRPASVLADSVTLRTAAEDPLLEATAEGDYDSVVSRLDGEELVTADTTSAESTYPVDTLVEIAAVAPDDGQIQLRLGTERPAEATIEFGDGRGKATHYVAPIQHGGRSVSDVD